MLRFPQAALDAARAQLDTWGVLAAPLEQRVGLLAERLDAWNQDRAYGVRDAILCGTRIRLLDQVGTFADARFNCAETGMNVFLLATQLGLETPPFILRYQPGSQYNDHFAVVCQGDGRYCLDPLMSNSGSARMMRDAIVIQTAGGRKIIKGSYTTLDEDAALRHRNFINGPSGFFPYYADSQRIVEAPHRFSGASQWRVRTENEELRILFTVAARDDLLAYTFERVYAPDGVKDRHMLHLDDAFRGPQEIVYLEDPTPQVLAPKDRFAKRAMAFRYGVHAMNDLMLEIKTNLRGMIDEHLARETDLKRETERLQREKGLTLDAAKERFLQIGVMIHVLRNERWWLSRYREQASEKWQAERLAKATTDEEIEGIGGLAKYGKQMIDRHHRIRAGDRWELYFFDDAQAFFRDRAGFSKHPFPSCRKELWRPFKQTPEAQETLGRHLGLLLHAYKSAYRHDIKQMFSSPVIPALLGQYHDALEIKRLAERLVA